MRSRIKNFRSVFFVNRKTVLGVILLSAISYNLANSGVSESEAAGADGKHSFGTKMIVPGYNNSQPVKMLDRGRAICGNRLDVFFNSHRKAKKWGVKYLRVKVCTD